MRGFPFFPCVSILLSFNAPTTRAQLHGVAARQESHVPPSANAITTSAGAIVTSRATLSDVDLPPASTQLDPQATATLSSTSNGGIQTTASLDQSPETASASKGSPSSTFATMTISISTTAAATPARTSAASGIDMLPIQPVISPALGVAGILLMAFGIAYTFIGVRQKLLHIFCAVTYLVALAITVLLVYIVNPPVAPSIQGAYLVAAFVPGIIIGASSLIFREIVEGLGCLLGGFCFAMWLLCLAPGGLIHSNGGRIGLIVAFSAACFSLSFSRYTRTYGSIGCIAFAGSTSIVLGIDCFSRAGLKEFWIYNWDLNELIFPIGTSSYPTTRGIKVESAIIVIITIFGVMSQIKLWNVIKQRRREREQTRMQDQEDREHLEANLGRRIENTNEREKAHWEKIYGGKGPISTASITGSTMASTYELGSNSASNSTRELAFFADPRDLNAPNTESMEMRDMSTGGLPNNKGASQGIVNTQRGNSDVSDAIKRHHRTNTLERLEAGLEEHRANRQSANIGPVVAPLPFRVPSEADLTFRARGNSVTTDGGDLFDDSHRIEEPDKLRAQPERVHRTSIESQENGLDIRQDHDQASSVAATFDELTDDEEQGLPKLSRSASPVPTVGKPDRVVLTRRRSLSSMDVLKKENSHLLDVPGDVKSVNRKSMPTLEDLQNVQSSNGNSLFTPSTALTDKLGLRTKSQSPDQKDQLPKMRRATLKKEFLPQDQPSVASIYRTNEWAKHQMTAETPSMEAIAPPSEEGVSVNYGDEVAVPLDMDTLQQTAFSSNAPVARAPSLASSTNFNHSNNMHHSDSQSAYVQLPSQISPMPNVNDVPTTSPIQARSPVLQQTPTQRRLNSMRSGNLSTTLLAQPLVESPTEESAALDRPLRRSISEQRLAQTQPNASTTLLGRREDMLSARKSSTNLNNPLSSPSGSLQAPSSSQTGSQSRNMQQGSTSLVNTNSIYSNFEDLASGNRQSILPSDSLSLHGIQILPKQQEQSFDPDDIPLSQRKEIIRRSSMSQAANAGARRGDFQYPFTSTSHTTANAAGGVSSVIYDAHMPKRGPSFTATHAEARMAMWRSDLHVNERLSQFSSTQVAQAQDEALQRLREERWARGEAEQRRERERSQQQGALDERMRTGEMLRTHAEVMRRMQRNAKAS